MANENKFINTTGLKHFLDKLLARDNTWSGTNTFSKTISGSINGNATTATTATNLTNTPSLLTSGNTIAVKAGEKTSSYITVPYATAAESATNATTTYGTIDYYFRPYAGANAIYRYKITALDKDNRLVPIVTTDQQNTTMVVKTPNSTPFRPHNLWLYNTTASTAANSVVPGQVLLKEGCLAHGTIYNFNENIAAYKMIYLRGTYDATTDLFTLYNDGTATLKTYYVAVPNNMASISLSSYFISGFYYIAVGAIYSSANYLQLFNNNDLFYFDGTNLIAVEQKLVSEKQDALSTDQLAAANSSITSTKVTNYDAVATSVDAALPIYAGSGINLSTTSSGIQINSTATGTAATKDYTTSVTSGSADLVTSGAVYSALGDQVTFSYSCGVLTITTK